jgi:CSLREA domain-containing protein
MSRRTRIALAAAVAALTLAVAAGPASAASLTVTTLADEVNADTACSLREAIANANHDDVSGSAACAAGGGADTIDFGSLAGTITLTAGELTISDADGLTIDGGDDVTISGNNASRVFAVEAAAQLRLRDLTVSGGRVDLDAGDADADGGGIRNLGTLEVEGSTISGNLANGLHRDQANISRGGGVYNDGTLTVTNSAISDNVADNGHGGGIYNDTGTVMVRASTLSGNSVPKWTRTLGGNIFNYRGAMTVIDSMITGGLAEHGGGILSDGTMTISGSTLAANTAGVTGAGMQSFGTLTLTNSTISGNTSPRDGGGLTIGGSATITNSTITGNSAPVLGGINAFGAVTLKNTIVANNPGGDCGGAVDGGHNLIEDGSCIAAATMSFSGDPLLGPLADNGGPTETHALLDGSIAINAGSNPFAAGLDFDQRGHPFARIVGRTVDIGAYESSGYDFTGFFSPVDNPPTLNKAKAGSSIPVKFSLGGDQGLDVLADGSPRVERYTCGDVDDADPIEQTSTANQGLTYNARADTYTYVWKTNKGWKGKCATLTLELDDGTEHTALFQFK